MTQLEFNENTRLWGLGYHYTALTTTDIGFARELYELRLEALNEYIEYLEQEVAQNGTKSKTIRVN